ncbi:ABC-three component system middle component 1 [Priestia megaterium]
MGRFDIFQKEDIIKNLKSNSKVIGKYDVKAWIKPQGSYKINIFTITLNNSDELKKIWEIITNDIAIHFQSELEKNIERWNIYVVFLINEPIEKELKYQIEQDKYSSRKIICDNFNFTSESPKDLQIISLLNHKLFDFQLHQLKETNKLYEQSIDLNIEDMIKSTDARLYQVIKYAKNNSSVKPEKLLDLYME